MLQKLKSTSISVLPLIGFVLLVHFTMYKFSSTLLLNFFIGCAVLIIGQVIFLTGIDNSIVPMGQFVGNSVTDQKKFYIFVLFGFIFGVLTTIAEPDLQVLSGKIYMAGFGIPKVLVLVVSGIGVGALISIGLIRIVTKHSLGLILFILYALIAVLGIFVSEKGFAMCLDAGACTTGVVTSPFLLALGIGVAKMVSASGKTSGEENFGLIALSSAGPIVLMLILTIIFSGTGSEVVVEQCDTPLLLETLKDVSFSLFPLFIAFFVFEVIFIKISKTERLKLVAGSITTFVGLYLFLFGIEFGLTDMGSEFGKALASVNKLPITIIICAGLGFGLAFCEPSIRILAEQIEEVTNRNLKVPFIMVFMGVSIVLSITLVILQSTYNFSIWWIYGIMYGLSFIMMPFVSKLFTSIAFDSSGVATGTITVAFIFPIMLGLNGTLGGFGTLGIMGMTPVFVMEVLGIIFRINVEVENKKTQKILVRLSKTDDIYSNIEKLKQKHIEEFEGRVV